MLDKLEREWRVISDNSQMYRTKYTSISLIAEEVIRDLLHRSNVDDQRSFKNNIYEIVAIGRKRNSHIRLYGDATFGDFLHDLRKIRNDELHYSNEDEEKNFGRFVQHSYKQTLDYLKHHSNISLPKKLSHYDNGKEVLLSEFLTDLVSKNNSSGKTRRKNKWQHNKYYTIGIGLIALLIVAFLVYPQITKDQPHKENKESELRQSDSIGSQVQTSDSNGSRSQGTKEKAVVKPGLNSETNGKSNLSSKFDPDRNIEQTTTNKVEGDQFNFENSTIENFVNGDQTIHKHSESSKDELDSSKN